MTLRDHLKKDFEERRKRNPHFSLRSYSKWLGLSPAFLSQVLSGRRNVSPTTGKQVLDRLGVSPAEKSYFLGHLSQIQIDETPLPHENVDQETFEVISDWVSIAICAMAKMRGAQADPRWIAQKLEIPVEQARESYQRLLRLGMIEENGGTFRHVKPPMVIPSTEGSAAIRRFHKQNLERAYEKIDTVPANDRRYHGLTVALSRHKLDMLQEQIDKFLDSLEAYEEPTNASDVYHVAIQVFPQTKDGR